MTEGAIKRLGKILLPIGLVLVLAIGAAVLVMHKKAELSQKAKPASRPTAVHTASPVQGRLPVTEHYIGTIEPLVFANLSARATGHLYSVAGDVGDTVRKGDTVALVDPQIPKREKKAVAAELKGAEEALAMSEKILDRRQVLVEKGHAPEEELDQARRQYVLDRARVKRLREELAAKKKHMPIQGSTPLLTVSLQTA